MSYLGTHYTDPIFDGDHDQLYRNINQSFRHDHLLSNHPQHTEVSFRQLKCGLALT